MEARLPLTDKRIYPCCVGGARRAPPEDCGGPLVFMERRDAVPFQAKKLFENLREDWEAKDMEAIGDRVEDIEELREWLRLADFDRRAVNRRLKQYATHDEVWVWQ